MQALQRGPDPPRRVHQTAHHDHRERRLLGLAGAEVQPVVDLLDRRRSDREILRTADADERSPVWTRYAAAITPVRPIPAPQCTNTGPDARATTSRKRRTGFRRLPVTNGQVYDVQSGLSGPGELGRAEVLGAQVDDLGDAQARQRPVSGGGRARRPATAVPRSRPAGSGARPAPYGSRPVPRSPRAPCTTGPGCPGRRWPTGRGSRGARGGGSAALAGTAGAGGGQERAGSC
jgi:hypothetical protein